jgi:hypothetical protein
MMRLFLPALAAALVLGCESKPANSTRPPQAKGSHTHPDGSKHDDHDDDDEHVRGKMKIEHAGPYHAALTVHLSPQGNELDLFFETVSKEPKPVALSVKEILATVTRKADNKPVEVKFLPADPKERPKDEKEGTCSHFVAKAPFVQESDILTVTYKVVIRDKERIVTYEDFEVKKFSEKHNH